MIWLSPEQVEVMDIPMGIFIWIVMVAFIIMGLFFYLLYYMYQNLRDGF